MTALVEPATFVPARQLPNGSCFYSAYGSFPFQADCVAEAIYRTAPDQDGGHLVVYDTGTGKTIIALASATFLVEDAEIDQVIVIAERNVIEDWHESAESFTNLRSAVYHGPGREKRLAKSGVPDVFVTTYETGAAELVDKPKGRKARGGRSVGPLVATLGLEHKRTLWVFDEATKLKNRASGLYRDWDWLLNTHLIRHAPHQRRLGLTATPMTTDMSDGFNIARFICPARMPTVNEFERECISGHDNYGRPVFDADAERIFAKRFQTITSRKRKTDSDVAPYFPAQHESARHVRLTRDHREFYETVSTIFDPPEGEEDMRHPAEVQRDDERLWNLVRMTAGHPGAHLHAENEVSQTIADTVGAEELRRIGSAKVPALLAAMRPFHTRGWPVVVFSFYKTVLAELALELDQVGLSHVQFHGGQTQKANERAKKTFMAGDTQVFLASDAAARGMNLQVSPAVIEYESALTYDKRVQRINRVSRLTSPWSDVYCRTLVLNGTVEDGILALAMKRNARQDVLLGDNEDGTGFISAESRREMLKVRSGRR